MKVSKNPQSLRNQFLVCFAKFIAMLPCWFLLACGRGLGRIAYRIAKKRRLIAQTNIQACFPQLNTIQVTQLCRQSFLALGMGLMEAVLGLWGKDKKLRKLFFLENDQIIAESMARGDKVILLGAHYSTLELLGRFSALGIPFPINIVYRRHESQGMEELINQARSRYFHQTIHRAHLRPILRALKAGEIVWIAPDQDLGPNGSVFAPFFGVPAATTTTIAKLAKMSGAKVILCSGHRTKQGYRLRFSEPLAPFPTDDALADATLLNQVIAESIQEYPEQYFWIHRRFKTQAKGAANFYPQAARRK